MAKSFREFQNDFRCSVGFEDDNRFIHIRDSRNDYLAQMYVEAIPKYINFLEDINNGVCDPKRNSCGDICTGSWCSGCDTTWFNYLDKVTDGYNGNWLMSRRLPELLEFLCEILPKHNIEISYKPLDISEITRDKLNEMSLSSLTRMYKRLQNENRD